MKRALLLLLLLLAPTVAAVALPPPPAPGNGGVCVQVGCARATDNDGDGAPDRATGAFIAGEQGALNLLVADGGVLWQADVTTFELGGHEVEHELEEAGVELPILTVAATGSAQAAGPASETYVEAYETDHETGIDSTLAWAYLFVALP